MRTPVIVRRLVPWASVLLIAALAVGILPFAFAAGGTSAADAIPVGTSGTFSGTAAPASSVWYTFAYSGGNQTATIAVTFEPQDATNLNLLLFTGDPSNPRQENITSTLSGNTRTITFADPNQRTVFIQVQNGEQTRSVSFVGTITPVGTIATPTPVTGTPTPQTTPTPGPVAPNAGAALTIGADGNFAGTLAPRQSTFYRFYYGNPGGDATVSVSFAPSASGGGLNLYTGSDVNALQQQSGSPTTSGNTLSRSVNLATAQWVYFAVGNTNDAATALLAYGGKVTPAFAPPATPTATVGATGTATATTTAAPVPTGTPQPAPAVLHDERYFPQTGYRVDNDAIWSYFLSRGQVDTFGFPVSRTFSLLGCNVQIFQREIAQVCQGAGNVALMNVLDPDIFPYTKVNGSTFPAPDDALKASTPRVSDPNYASAILDFVRANAPDTFNNRPVNFGQTFFGLITPQQAGTSDSGILGLIDLEIWGAPISRPMPDPSNSNFIYQRFQRGIMHFDATIGQTHGILLADYVKQIMIGPTLRTGGPNTNLPQDLAQQAQGSKYWAQYCPGAQGWICRAGDLPGTDLTFAFEQG